MTSTHSLVERLVLHPTFPKMLAGLRGRRKVRQDDLFVLRVEDKNVQDN